MKHVCRVLSGLEKDHRALARDAGSVVFKMKLRFSSSWWRDESLQLVVNFSCIHEPRD